MKVAIYWLKRALKYFGVGVGLSVILGSVVALIAKWPLAAGIYGICFAIGSFSMLYAGMMFVGTPAMRYDYLVRGKALRRQGKGHEVEEMEHYGILPALLGVAFIVLGFVIEAVTR